MKNFQFVNEAFEKVRDRLLSRSMFEGIPEWMCSNLRLKGKPWSFKDHEFQKEIVGSNANDLCVIKPSQVGLTECTIRMILCYLAMQEESTAIFVLPHANRVRNFSKARADPIINGSAKLRDLVVTGANSVELKMLGASSLYFTGASTDAAAISIPASLVAMDEFDFGDQDILSKFESRLSHNKDGGYRRKFSTPTVSGYGISAQFDLSSKARYMCRCQHCETFVAPECGSDIVIPGFSNEFTFFTKEDLKNPSYKWQSAYIKCPKCGKNLDESLADPERRIWVHESPSMARKGYAVKPFDVPAYNNAPKIVGALAGYRRHEDYVNFALGQTYASEINQVNIEAVKANTMLLGNENEEGCFMGVDIGRTCNVTIGKRINGKYVVKKFTTVDVRQENADQQLEELFKEYCCLSMVMDIGPDFSLCKKMSERLPGQVYFCQYINKSKSQIEWFRVNANKEIEEVVSAIRTEAFDLLVKDINTGNFIFPRCPEMEIVEHHFQGMKRITGDPNSETGETNQARWVKVRDDDHYLHSTLYFYLAVAIAGADEVGYASIAPTGISSVPMAAQAPIDIFSHLRNM